MDLRHLFREKMFHQSVLCVFFSGQLAYWMKPSPQTSNPLKPHTPPPSPFRSFGCILQLPSPPLAIQPSWRRDKKQEEMGWGGGRGGVWVGSCSGGGRLEKESESVAPTESAEGQWAEIGPLVRGYSLKMWSVSHWAGTVDDKGTPVLMKSSLLSYQSLRVWGLFVFVLNVYVKNVTDKALRLCRCTWTTVDHLVCLCALVCACNLCIFVRLKSLCSPSNVSVRGKHLGARLSNVCLCACGLLHICLSHCISPSSKGMSSASPSLPICLPWSVNNAA